MPIFDPGLSPRNVAVVGVKAGGTPAPDDAESAARASAAPKPVSLAWLVAESLAEQVAGADVDPATGATGTAAAGRPPAARMLGAAV